MDFENISINVDENKIGTISEKCNELLSLQKEIVTKKAELSVVEDRANILQERVIPDLMQEAGVSFIKLADGSSV